MTPKDFLQRTLTDIKVKLGEEFDRNFERKAFFDEKWKSTKLMNSRDSLMMRTGNLRKSLLNPKISNDGILWTSAMPYAEIHNSGGELKVTPQMRKFFWAMYYKTQDSRYKWMALTEKETLTIHIPKRQFIGESYTLDKQLEKLIIE